MSVRSCPDQCPSCPPLVQPSRVSSAPALSEAFALDGNAKQNEQNARNMLLRATERNKIWRPHILALAPAAPMLPPTDRGGKQQGARAGRAVRAKLGGSSWPVAAALPARLQRMPPISGISFHVGGV